MNTLARYRKFTGSAKMSTIQNQAHFGHSSRSADPVAFGWTALRSRSIPMFDQYLQQLVSQDAAQRRQAIIALGNSGDAQALAALANVYKTDPDPALRELALKAGRYIKRPTFTAPSD